MNVVVTPDAAFLVVPDGKVQNFPSAQKTETLEQIKRDPIFIASHAKDPHVFFRAGGTEKVGSVDARTVDVNAAGAAIRWFVDPQSGQILKETYSTLTQAGPAQGETTLENWRTVDGVTLPFSRKNKQNGQDSSRAEITAIEFNPTVDPKLFEKPLEKPPSQP
jgi:hypothetical protein